MTELIAVEAGRSKVTTTKAADWAAFVEGWIKFAQVKPVSVNSYMKGVKNFFAFLKANGISDITRDTLLSYREYLGAKYKAATANLYLTATKLFVGYLYQLGIIPVDVTDRIKNFKVSEQHAKNALSVKATKEIMSSFNVAIAESANDSDLSAKKRAAKIFKLDRDKAIYAVMTCCGLRCVEVMRANKGDLVDDGVKVFLYVQGKGRDDKKECVEVPAGVMELINKYLAGRGGVADDEPLFASVSRRNFGGRLTTNSISRLVKGIFRQNGIDSEKVTAHSLRHTCANTMITNGVELRRVQEVLRHKNITVTQRYLHELDRYNNGGEVICAAAFGL